MPAETQRRLRVHLLRLAAAGETGVISLPVQGGRCTCIKAPPVPKDYATWVPLGNEPFTRDQSRVLDETLSLLEELSTTRWDGTILIEVTAGIPALPRWAFTDNYGTLGARAGQPTPIRAVK